MIGLKPAQPQYGYHHTKKLQMYMNKMYMNIILAIHSTLTNVHCVTVKENWFSLLHLIIWIQIMAQVLSMSIVQAWYCLTNPLSFGGETSANVSSFSISVNWI